MSVSIVKESPELLTVTIQGPLTAKQWQQSLNEIAAAMTPDTETSVLILGKNFGGWVPGGWDDVIFSRRAERMVPKMALVADPKWEQQAKTFVGVELRLFQLKFFPTADVAKARQWLASPT
jgi:hypothetical protein